MPEKTADIEQRLLQRLYYLESQRPGLLRTLIESKHIATHKGVPHRDRFLSTSHRKYSWAVKDKEEKKSKAAILAAAGIAGLVAATKQRMVRQFLLAEKYLKLSQTAKTEAERRIYRKKFTTIIAVIKADLKKAYFRSYRFGIQSSGSGGEFRKTSFMSPEEYEWVNSAFNHEMRFLNRLIADVEGGRQVSTLTTRIGMYAKTLGSAYSTGQVMATSRETIVHWTLDPNAKHCEDCIYLANLSPFVRDTLPTVPRAGRCRCGSNCKCSLSYEYVGTERARQVQAGNLSREYVLRQMKSRRMR